MASSIGGLPTPNGAAAPRLRQDIEDLAAAVDLVSTPVFATTTARDSAYAAAITAGEFGMRCYITNRAGFSVYRHVVGGVKGWRWEPAHDELFVDTRVPAAQATGSALIPIIISPSIALPPGNRRIRLEVTSLAQNVTGSAYATAPRVWLVGQGLDSTAHAQTNVPAGVFTGEHIHRGWTVIVSGTCQWTMSGQNATFASGQIAEFIQSRLEIYDLGPAD